MIGIAGLLALFLTIVFVVVRPLIFPAAAAPGPGRCWPMSAIEFGFWRKIFGFEDDAERIWRAGVEATLGATVIIFLFANLNLRRWHVRDSHIAAVWLLLMAAVVALSIYNAPIAAGVARISIATVAGVGLILILSMAARGFDRAVMLIPTWFLLLVWVAAAGFTVMGTFTNDLAAPGLIGGLVLIVMLIGFTVMQNAFSGSNVSHVRGGVFRAPRFGDDRLRRRYDVDWDVDLDQIHVSSEIEAELGPQASQRSGKTRRFAARNAAADGSRPLQGGAPAGCCSSAAGRINQDFRLRAADGHYFWFHMKARPVVNSEGEVIRVISALSDVTEIETAEERMLHDAVHDNLTVYQMGIVFDRLEPLLIASRRPRLGDARRAGDLRLTVSSRSTRRSAAPTNDWSF